MYLFGHAKDGGDGGFGVEVRMHKQKITPYLL
jgi:hypothetical protein